MNRTLQTATATPARPRSLVAWQRLRPLVPVLVISGLLALVPFPTCLLRLALGTPCPACGFTRATVRLLHGDLRGSFLFHPLALPGAVGLLVAMTLAYALPDGHPGWPRFERAVLHTAAVGFLVVWVLRLARVLPPV